MIIILTSPKGKRWKAQPYSNGLCFECFVENENYGKPIKQGKRKGQIDTTEWRSLGLYPSDLPAAIRILINRMTMDPDEKITISAPSSDYKGIKKCIETYLNKITKEVIND